MRYILPIFILLFIAGCADEEPSLSESFLKIYDNSDSNLSYHPIDVVETIDGYIVLSATERSNTDFAGVQLTKIDEEGNFEFELELEDYIVPVGEMYLNPADSNTYFFVIDDPTSLEAVLLAVNPQLEVQSETSLFSVTYPLAASITSGGNFLLESYDPIAQEIELAEISLTGQFSGQASYSIGPGSDVLEEINDHYLGRSPQPLPFFCGEVSPGNYYFNGFYNYSFSLVFTDFSANPQGVVQGLSSDAGIRSIMSLGGDQFAVAGYQYDHNFQLASTSLTTNGLSSTPEDLYPGNMADLKPYTPSKILSYETLGTTYTIFAAETKGNQISLYFYDATTGEIEGLHKIGFFDPFSFASMKETTDGSLLVLGTTFVAGRFERIILNKISQKEISSILK